MKPEPYKYYTAKISYHRTDDLREDALPSGTKVHAQALWIADEGQKYEGDVIFSIAESYYNLPERDLIDFKESTHDEFKKHRI